MVFWNRKEKEELYDCTTEDDYIAYKAIVNHKYTEWFKHNPSEDDLKRKLFTINTAFERCNKFDSSVSLTISIALITIILDERLMNFLWSYCTNYFTMSLFMLVKVAVVWVAIYNAIKGWGESYRLENKELSMLKLEKQVLKELIAEKSKPHKVKAKVRRK